jgi:hypothetical protein
MEGNVKDGEPTTALLEPHDIEMDPREDENVPLLINVASDDAEEDTSNKQTPQRWALETEFDGLSWWRKPSVSSILLIANKQKNLADIFLDILASSWIFPLQLGIWRNRRPSTQPRPDACLSEIHR